MWSPSNSTHGLTPTHAVLLLPPPTRLPPALLLPLTLHERSMRDCIAPMPTYDLRQLAQLDAPCAGGEQRQGEVRVRADC